MCQTMRGKPIYFLSNGPPLRESDICLDKGSACGILGIPVPVVSYNCYTSMKERIYAPFKKGALRLIWGGQPLEKRAKQIQPMCIVLAGVPSSEWAFDLSRCVVRIKVCSSAHASIFGCKPKPFFWVYRIWPICSFWCGLIHFCLAIFLKRSLSEYALDWRKWMRFSWNLNYNYFRWWCNGWCPSLGMYQMHSLVDLQTCMCVFWGSTCIRLHGWFFLPCLR